MYIGCDVNSIVDSNQNLTYVKLMYPLLALNHIVRQQIMPILNGRREIKVNKYVI